LNQKVKLIIRPLVKGKRRWIEARKTNSSHDGTVFFLRWLRGGAKNYKYESIGKVTRALGQIRRANKGIGDIAGGGRPTIAHSLAIVLT
jgi:hypothetical protein